VRPVGLGVLVGALVLVALSGLPTAIADVPSDDGRVLQAAGCHEGVEATEARECLVVGGKRSRPLVMLFGDSHAAQLRPALEEVATRHQLRLAQLTKSGCPVAVVDSLGGRVDPHPDCTSWRKSALAVIRRMNPDTVVVASSYHYQDLQSGEGSAASLADYFKTWRSGFRKTLGSVTSAGRPGVVVVRDPPRFGNDLAACLAEKPGKGGVSCGLSRSEAVNDTNRGVWSVETAVSRGMAKAVRLDLTDEVCTSSFCSPVDVRGLPRYFDGNHFAGDFSVSLWPSVSGALAKVVRMPPSKVDGLTTQRSRGRLLLKWRKAMPGSAKNLSYRTTLTPQRGWRSKGAKSYACSGRKARCRTGRVPANAVYKVSVVAVTAAGASIPLKASTRKLK